MAIPLLLDNSILSLYTCLLLPYTFSVNKLFLLFAYLNMDLILRSSEIQECLNV